MQPARTSLLIALCAWFLLGGTARAQPSEGAATYALVVGSNAAGPGQLELRYAEDDARRVGALLVELGGHPRDAVDVVVRPTPDQLRARLDRLTTRVTADVAAGRQVRLFFYYSGHARATGIDLGSEALPLAELRARLVAVPATLTVVVLDACQSGAFSRIKGATPAADFSFHSRQHLDASGIAVLASSSSSELSQESEQLASSYFTHHLLVGLRGAGDANGDGAVSLDEAYRYSYHQTLAATSVTAVGRQHVSLEVDLKGHGEVPLSFPRAASASIELPAALAGHALVFDHKARAVVAEIQKAKGSPVRIAIAPGEYEVVVRDGGTVRRCPISTGRTGATIDLARCTREAAVAAATKGGYSRPMKIELIAAIGPERRDGFTHTLEDFGYIDDGAASSGLGLAVSRRIDRRLWIGGSASFASSPRWTFESPRAPLEFQWTTASVLAFARGIQSIGESRFGLYAQFGAGVAVARSALDGPDGMTTRETHVGPAFSLGAGLHVGDMRGFAFSAGYQLDYALALANTLDETHASGGHRLGLGVSYSY
ncbi:MAG: caspase family protein [Kofleriaceae bacterium]